MEHGVSLLHQLSVQLAGCLGYDADVADDAHEIGVTAPAGNDVLVEVARQARAGTAAEVQAEVEALGADGALEEPDRIRRLLLHVELLRVSQQLELPLVGARGDE